MKKVDSGKEVSSLNFEDFLPEEKTLEFNPLDNYYKYIVLIEPKGDEYKCRIVNLYNDNKIDFDFTFTSDKALEDLEGELEDYIYMKFNIYITGVIMKIGEDFYVSHNNMTEINDFYNRKLEFIIDKVNLKHLRAFDFISFKLNRYMKYYKINNIMLVA